MVTRDGRPTAVIVGYEYYQSLIETLNILSDSEAMNALAEAEDDLAAEGIFDL